MKKQLWIFFCIISFILFAVSMYILFWQWQYQRAVIIYTASIALFAVPTLICFDKKMRLIYGISYAVAGVLLLLISPIGMLLLFGITFGLITVIIAGTNKGEKL